MHKLSSGLGLRPIYLYGNEWLWQALGIRRAAIPRLTCLEAAAGWPALACKLEYET